MRHASLALVLALAACGSNGKNGTSCTIAGQQITCSDGTSATITNGTNGSDGTNGSNGTSELVSVVTEPPGANCPNGGKAIETGVDTNGNGVLDPGEVTGTTYVCATTSGSGSAPTTVYGDVIVHNSLDVAALSGVETITGQLAIAAPAGLTTLSLPSLTHVASLVIDNQDLTTLSFPALVEATTSVLITDSGRLTTLDFGALTTTALLSLQGLSVPSLATFATLAGAVDLQLESCPNLTDLALPAVTTVNSIELASDTALTSLDSLGTRFSTTGGSILLYGNTLLTDLSALSGVTSLAQLELDDTQGFTDLTGVFPVLTSATTLTVHDTNLVTLSIPQLATVGSVSLDGNMQLATLDLPALTSASSISLGNIANVSTVDLSSVTSLASLELGTSSKIASLDLSSVETISGAITIYDTSLTKLDLPKLTSVAGIEIGGNANTSTPLPSLTEISMPKLTSVTGDLFIEETGAATVDLSSLATGGANYTLVGGDSLTTVRLDALTTAAKLFVGGAALAGLTLPSLTTLTDSSSVSTIGAFEADQLVSVAGMFSVGADTIVLPKLASVGESLYLTLGDGTTALALASLVTVDGAFGVSGDQLGTISLPAATTFYSVQISDLPLLMSISFPKLVNAQELVFEDDPQLPTCQVTALASQNPMLYELDDDGDDMTATCN